MTLAEPFAGGGGWSQAAKMAGGILPIWYSEIDKNKIAIYEKRHPGVPNLGDIRELNSPPPANIITLSFPCTGISNAGKGEGLENKDSRLWFDAERILGQSRYEYIVIENGPALTIRGLGTILAALAKLGYYAEWTHLSGTQFGIQQRRKRLYLIAYAGKIGQQSQQHTETIFRKIETGVRLHPMPVYPGWRERRDIPEPRTFGSAYDLPGIVHRLECVGDAIIPLIGMYILECIKLHATQNDFQRT